jgi:hypothetical protein
MPTAYDGNHTYDFGAALTAAYERLDSRPKRELVGRNIPSLPHTCPDAARASSAGSRPLLEHSPLCAKYMNRVEIEDEHGDALGMLGDPDPAKLARHINATGPNALARGSRRLLRR